MKKNNVEKYIKVGLIEGIKNTSVNEFKYKRDYKVESLRNKKAFRFQYDDYVITFLDDNRLFYDNQNNEHWDHWLTFVFKQDKIFKVYDVDVEEFIECDYEELLDLMPIFTIRRHKNEDDE